jgi:TonB-dependent receptor
MKISSYLKFIFALIFLFASIGYGQGILKGLVTDSTLGSPLIGANVFLKGTALGASTDLEGNYKIANIPPGKYNIKISYVGYITKEFLFTIAAGENKLNIRLAPDVIQGNEVIVTAQARGQVAAINQQLTSNTIVNVVSEERLQELPDVNAAEVIGRLPGVAIQRSGGEANKVVLRGLSDKFSSITVDGIRIAPTDADSRGVDLSTISQGSLAGIELYKALTSDKDADAIAGSVNLVTKKAPSERLLRVDAKGAYNQLNETLKQYDLTVRYGERFFDELIGVQVSGNIERRDRSNENLYIAYNNNYDGKGTDYQINNFGLNYTDEVRKRGGFSLLLDIATPDEGVIRINNIYNQTNRDYITYTRNYPTVGTIDLSYTARDIENEIKTFNSSIQGENNLFTLKVNWGVSFAQSNSENPYDYTIDFMEPAIVENGLTISRMNNMPDAIMKGPPEAYIPYALNNFNRAYLNWGYFRSEKNIDKEKTAFLDLSKKYSLLDKLNGELKIGGKYRYKNRFKQAGELASAYYIDGYREYYRAADGSVQKKNFAGTYFNDLQLLNGNVLAINFLKNLDHRNVYGKYDLYPMINKDALRAWWDINQNGYGDANGKNAEYKQNVETYADYYDIIERTAAGYIMNTFTYGENLTFIAGIRIENEDNSYKSRYSPGPLTGFPTPSGDIKDTSSSYSQNVVLPNFQLNLKALDFINLRLAAYKAIARPSFNDRLLKAVSRNSGSGLPGIPNVVTLRAGNPNLKTAEAWNYELSTSFFGNQLGLITISGFYKEIENMFHIVNGVPVKAKTAQEKTLFDSLGIGNWAPSPFVSGVQFALSCPYNSKKPTKVWGFELEHQTNFTFLPGYFQYIVLNYNLSLVRSETYVATSKFVKNILPYPPWESITISYGDAMQRLEGQPELFGNVALGYDIGGFSARISVFFQDEYNKSFSSDGRTDIIQGSFSRWDFVVKQQITDKISVILNLNNLTDYEEKDYIMNRVTGWKLLNTSQKYGLTADLGVRITL